MSIQNTLQRQGLLFLFDVGSTQIRSILTAHYSKYEMVVVLKEARQEFNALIPQLPDIGGWRNPHTQFIIAAALFLALYRVLKAHGRSADEVGTLIFEAVTKYSSQLGATVRLFAPIQRKLFGDQVARRLALVSQQRRYPNDFVCVYVEGDGASFDYGFDYLECGICKFFHTQKADEFAQYMCRLDYPYAEAMGSELIRTSTIAENGLKCDFRYKKQKIQH